MTATTRSTGKLVKRFDDARVAEVRRYRNGRNCVIVPLKPSERPKKGPFKGAKSSGTRFYGCFVSAEAALKRAREIASRSALPRRKTAPRR